MKKLHVSILLIACSGFLSAQISNAALPGSGLLGIEYSDISVINSKVKPSGIRNVESSYPAIKGSAYLHDERINATVISNDGIIIKDLPMIIDLYAGEFIATDTSGTDIVLDAALYNEIIFPYEGKNLSFKKLNPEKPNKFYEVLYNDDGIIFLKDHYVTVKEGTNSGLAKTDTKFSRRTAYYVKYGKSEFTKVKLKKKSVLSAFSRKVSSSMHDFAKRHKLDLKSEEDFVNFFLEYSTR